MTMVQRMVILLAGVLLISCALPASAQIDLQQIIPDDYSQSLYLDPLAFAGQTPDESRLDVFVQVGYDNLSFVKHGERYDASYEMTISVNDSSGSLVSEKSWTEEIKGITFDASVSATAYGMLERSFSLHPGKYTVTAMVRDLDSKVIKKFARRCVVPDFSSPIIAMSDIMLVSRLTIQDGKTSILPNVSPNVGNLSDSFFIFNEVYSRAGSDSIRLVARVYDKKGEKRLETDTVEYLRQGKNEVFMRITHMSLPLGDYLLTLRVYPAKTPLAQEEGFIAGTSRAFMVRWAGLPKAMKDIDVAIEQLQYIAKDNEMSELKKAKTIEEKQKKFLEFWAKRDPNPNTPRNEKMEEYYGRVEYANKHFTHYREGWRTDMGLVFIILGPPSNVERHPFEIDSKPYEIWSYYDINYQYVFVDQSGFSDYRLMSPLWEVYNRRRE